MTTHIPPYDPEPATASRDKDRGGTGVRYGGSEHNTETGWSTNAGLGEKSRGTPKAEATTNKRKVQRFSIQGEVPVES